jgi:hypothetical protein
MQDTETTGGLDAPTDSSTDTDTDPAALIDASDPEAAVEAAYEQGYADGQAAAYQSPASVDHPHGDGGAYPDEAARGDGAAGDMATSERMATTPAADGDQAAADCIADVATLVNGDRDSHGDAVDQQAAAAEAWSWYLRIHGYLGDGEAIAGSDVARMMDLLKISRGGVGEYDLEHDRDGVGYSGIAAACAVREGDADEAELTRGGE